MRIRGSILTPPTVEHQLRVVFQLDWKPVSTFLSSLQNTRTELMIHPALTRDNEGFPVGRQRSCRIDSTEAVIVRSVPKRRALATQTLLAM